MEIQPVCTDEFVNAVLDRYSDMVYRIALTQTKKKENAEDVYQEVFLRLIQAKKPFESEEHIKAWLIRVTINCSRKIFASSWFRRTVPLEEDLELQTPEKSDIFRFVAALPQTYSIIIYLYYKEDYSLKEISALLHMKEATVRSRLFRARNMLRKELGGEQDEG